MIDRDVTWRISSYSSSDGTCVALARRADGSVLVRNSNRPDAGTLQVSPDELAAWFVACRAGELDDLAEPC